MAQEQRPQQSAPARPANRGPVSILLSAVLGLFFATIMSWLFGITVEIAGLYFFWPEQGVRHSETLVQDGLATVAEYPTSAMVPDTAGFAQSLADTVAKPFIVIGALSFIKAHSGPIPAGLSHMQHSVQLFLKELARYVVIASHVAQSIAIRLAIVLYALPLLALLCLLALVDGLVRRDLRKWSGGRESSFVYHHAKKLTTWGLTGGFAIVLAWPFSGFNPITMVVALCAFAAWSLSITAASFKKYI